MEIKPKPHHKGRDAYGRYYNLTGYEGRKVCFMCGADLPGKRPRRYCSPGCIDLYLALFWWPQASRMALKRAHYKCDHCGITQAGILSMRLKVRTRKCSAMNVTSIATLANRRTRLRSLPRSTGGSHE